MKGDDGGKIQAQSIMVGGKTKSIVSPFQKQYLESKGVNTRREDPKTVARKGAMETLENFKKYDIKVVRDIEVKYRDDPEGKRGVTHERRVIQFGTPSNKETIHSLLEETTALTFKEVYKIPDLLKHARYLGRLDYKKGKEHLENKTGYLRHIKTFDYYQTWYNGKKVRMVVANINDGRSYFYFQKDPRIKIDKNK